MFLLPYLYSKYKDHYKYGQGRLKYAGLVGTIGYPLFYLLYTTAIPQNYENLFIRIVAALLCLFLFIKDHWPQKFKKYYIIYSYFVILYCLPFFHTFMTLKNGGNIVFIADSFMAVFFMVLLVDWRNVALMYIVGTSLGIILYIMTSIEPYMPMDYVERTPAFILVMVGGSLFKYSNALIEEEKSKLLKSLAGSIAHELRNPLNSIRLSVSSLVDQITRKPKAELIRMDKDEIIQILHKEQGEITKHRDILDQTVQLANEVIDMTLLDLSGKPLSKSDFSYINSKEAIVDTMRIYGYQTKEEQSKVKFHNIDEEFILNAAPTAFKYILFNLVKNALFYINEYEHSIITIGVETNIEYSTNQKTQKKYNVIYVHDTGPGIPEAALGKIFDSFYTSGKKGGTGLGLDFCKRTMLAFGGDIICESKFKEYTKFSLLFPIVPKNEIKKHTASKLEDVKTSAYAKLLIVDDQKTNLSITKQKIETGLPGIICDTALSGKKALELINNTPEKYHLILLDIQMPKMGGIEVAKRIRDFDKNIPIVALTSMNYREFSKSLKQNSNDKYPLNNFNYYLNKSAPSNILFRAITKWIIKEDNLLYLGQKEKYIKALENKKVLLADDQEMNLSITKRKLEKNGLYVTTAKNGKELIKLYKASLDDRGGSEFDLVITDINMPPFNGDEATLQIRKIEENFGVLYRNRIPIIALSGDGDKDDIYHFLRSQMTDYFIKGNNPELLTKIIANYLTSIYSHEYGPDANKDNNAITITNADTQNNHSTINNDLDSNIIDGNKLAIIVDDNLEEAQEILELFIRDSKNLMVKIKKSFKEKNLEKLYYNVHALKGISGNIGATILFNYTKKINNTLKNKEFPEDDNWLAELNIKYKDTINQIKKNTPKN